MVQTSRPPDLIVHGLGAQVPTLANKQAVLDFLLRAIVVREGPTTGKRAGGERAAHSQTQHPAQAVAHSCTHTCATHLYHTAVHTAVPHSPCQSQPNAIVSKPAKRREMLQKISGMLWFVMSNCNKQTGLGQRGLITAQCSGGAGDFPDLFPVQV